MAEEKAHAEFSASGSERWLNCPGSIALSKKAPPQVETPYAAEGTMAHACLERILGGTLEILGRIPNFESAAAMISKLGSRIDFPEEMVVHARKVCLWIARRVYRLGSSRRSLTLRLEERVDSSPFTCEGQFGTLDAAIIEPFGRLTVIDYKYGQGIVVDPAGINGKGNAQLVYYALAVSHEYDHNFEDVELVVIQPRAPDERGKVIRRHLMTMDELLRWEQIFRKGVKRAKKPNAALKSGKWCRFCPAAVLCPELVEENFKRAEIVFSRADGIESVPEPRLVKAQEIGRMLDAAEKLEGWIERLREHAFHLLENGHPVTGYKLVEKRSVRRWTDEAAVIRAAMKSGIEPLKSELKSPAQIEKELKAGKVDASWVKSLTSSQSSGLTMVKESDTRFSVNRFEQAAKVFGPVIDVV